MHYLLDLCGVGVCTRWKFTSSNKQIKSSFMMNFNPLFLDDEPDVEGVIRVVPGWGVWGASEGLTMKKGHVNRYWRLLNYPILEN